MADGGGSPLKRDPAFVKQDVIEGWISPKRAREVYGVVLNCNGEIDEAATAARREQMQRSSEFRRERNDQRLPHCDAGSIGA